MHILSVAIQKEWPMIKQRKILLLLTIIIASSFLFSCMQALPPVHLQVNYYDNDAKEWKVIEGTAEKEKFIYNQEVEYSVPDSEKYSFEVDADEIAIKDGSLKVKKRYTFDTKTWSLSSTLGKQDIFTSRLKSTNVNLYAYYDVETKYYKDNTAVDIDKDLHYSYVLYDSASFYAEWPEGAPGSPKDEYNMYVNLNFNTTKIDGTNILDSDYYDFTNKQIDYSDVKLNTSIKATDKAKGYTRTVTIPYTITRHGYRLAGWSRTFDAIIPEFPASKSFELEISDGYLGEETEESKKENAVNLYAIWERDTADYYTLTDFSKNGVFFPPYFKESYLPTPQSGYFFYYPKYAEIKIPAKGYYVRSDILKDVENDAMSTPIEHDFAIGEHVITRGMYMELQRWQDLQTDKPYGFQKYYLPDFPIGNDAKANPERPLTGVNPLQAMIIANAFTEYYNAHNQSTSRFTYVYNNPKTNERVRTMEDAVALITTKSRKPGTTEDKYVDGFGANLSATGFRIPTTAEWVYAASGRPVNNIPSDYEEGVSGEGTSRYPSFENRTNVVSGDNAGTSEASYAYFNGKSYPIGFQYLDAPTSTINKYLPNNFGVRGMSGNVDEWVDMIFSRVMEEKKLTAVGGNFSDESAKVYLSKDTRKTIELTEPGEKEPSSIVSYWTNQFNANKDMIDKTGLRLVRSINV